MGNNAFAPYSLNPLCFIVKNITREPKVVNIFQYPILPGKTRDLMQIPGVSEESIRAALLKGEIKEKLDVGDIEVMCSDVDLLQFNDEQRTYLQNNNISTGTVITPDQAPGLGGGGSGGGSVNYLFRQDVHLIGLQNGLNRIFYTPDIFLDGYYQNNYFYIEVFHNGRKLAKNIEFSVSESAGPGTGFNMVNFLTFSPISSSLLRTNYIIKAN